MAYKVNHGKKKQSKAATKKEAKKAMKELARQEDSFIARTRKMEQTDE